MMATMLEQSESKNWEAIQELWTRRMFAAALGVFGFTVLLHGIGYFQLPAGAATQNPVNAGGLRCDAPIWNFGLVDSIRNPRLSHEFEVVNETNETVSIVRIHSSCGCMVADNYDSELAPGQSTRLQVDLQLPPTPQRVRHDLAVQTNTGILPLRVVGEVAANRTMFSTPTVINFGTIKPGETKERTVRLFRRDFSPIGMCRIESDLPGIKEEFVNVSEYETTLVVTFSPDMQEQPRRIETAIFLFSADREAPELRIPVRAMMLSAENE